MAQEIELKFIVEKDSVDALRQHLHTLSGEYQEPICELELELLEGDANDVLKLARRLVNQSGLRQGSLSKAARGYHLAAGNAPRVLKETTILRVAPKASVEQGLDAALERALSQWQYHVVRGDQ